MLLALSSEDRTRCRKRSWPLMPNEHNSPQRGGLQQAQSMRSKLCVMKIEMAQTELKEPCYGLTAWHQHVSSQLCAHTFQRLRRSLLHALRSPIHSTGPCIPLKTKDQGTEVKISMISLLLCTHCDWQSGNTLQVTKVSGLPLLFLGNYEALYVLLYI